MALLLQNIFEETKKTYKLELICGKNGLLNIMKWVYISEDINTSAFLQGGELIITTGVSSRQSASWLYDFIDALIRQKTCGLILNLGAYIRPEDITPEIRTLCEHADYPLFTMPWETRIFDITHDYYNRIFHDTQTEQTITEAFINLLRGTGSTTQNEAILAEYGYPAECSYCICCLKYRIPEDTLLSETATADRILLALERYLKSRHPKFHLCRFQNTFYIIATDGVTETAAQYKAKTDAGFPGNAALFSQTTVSEDLLQQMNLLTKALSARFPDTRFFMGLGSRTDTLSGLSRSYLHAQAAASMAAARDVSFCSFDEMGFFKILLSVNDRRILEEYVEEQLGAVLRYDKVHGSNYRDTLYQYLLCDGSIIKIAAALYCHRNTVNYRIRILKEELGYPLEDMQARFSLMAAFWILEYLTTLSLDPSHTPHPPRS